jgi:hypothetical protein
VYVEQKRTTGLKTIRPEWELNTRSPDGSQGHEPKELPDVVDLDDLTHKVNHL